MPAAPKAKKKAKLAHEKGIRGGERQAKIAGEFSVHRVFETISWPDGKHSAIVELEEGGDKAIVDRWFVRRSAETGEWEPSQMACPALYDEVARKNAIDRYSKYASEHPAA